MTPLLLNLRASFCPKDAFTQSEQTDAECAEGELPRLAVGYPRRRCVATRTSNEGEASYLAWRL